MPGLVGYVCAQMSTSAANADAVFDRALDADRRDLLAHGGGRPDPQVIGGPGGPFRVARSHLGIFPSGPRSAADAPVDVLVHGELHEDVEAGGGGAQAWMRARYLDGGLEAVVRARGAYCAVIVDRGAHVLHLVNDRLGSYPLYWMGEPGGFYFAWDVITTLALAGAPAELDLTAVAQFLRFGFVCEDRTLCGEVKLLRPGVAVSVSLRDASLREWEYARPGEWFACEPGHQDFGPVKAAFRAAVSRATAPGPSLAMSLSGGLDSRAILASALERAGDLQTFTCGIPGCADQAIGARLARRAGTEHHFLPHREQVLDQVLAHFSNMVRLCDGMYLSHGVTEIHDLENLRPFAPEVLLRGHGGELAKMDLAWPFHTDARVKRATDLGSIIDFLYERVNFVSDSRALGQVLSPDLARDLDMRSRSAFHDMLRVGEFGPIEACSYLYLYQHHRRFTIASLALFRRVSEIRMPFVDEDFLTELFRLDPSARTSTALHRSLIAEDAPALGRVRDANTGTSATAGAVRRFVFDKANSALARLRIPGFRHYHQFDEVFRSVLLGHVEEVLLDPRARIEGLLERTKLERAVVECRQGRSQLGYLLQALLGIELWLQTCEAQ